MKKLTANFVTYDDASRAFDQVASQVNNPRIYNTAITSGFPDSASMANAIDPALRYDYMAMGPLGVNAFTAGLPPFMASDYYYDGYTRHVSECTTLEMEVPDSEYERLSQMLYSRGAVFVDVGNSK